MTSASKSSAINTIQAYLVTPVNAVGKWATDNDPTEAATEYDPHPLNWDLVAGQVLSTYPSVDNLTALNMEREGLIGVIRNTAVAMSRLRHVRLQKTNYPYTDFFYDNTAPANMNYSFGLPLSSFPYPNAGVLEGTVEALDLDAYCQQMNAILTDWKNQTLTYVEKYCHSNCHSNCHGNRGRR